MKQTIKRKLFRMLALFYPLFYLKYAKEETIYVSAAIAFVAVVIESLRFYSHNVESFAEKIFSPIAKEEETRRVSGITYMALGALFCVIFSPRIVAIPVLLCSIFGDSISSLVSKKYNRIKLFRTKSLEGVFACFGICIITNLLLLKTLLSAQGLTLNLALIISLVVTFFDMLPLPLDDNLSTPVGAGFLVAFLGIK